jgi:SOS-response transcriptional repressor LexA
MSIGLFMFVYPHATIKKMEFSEWLTRKYIDWRGDAIGHERTVNDFAAWIGVSQPLVSQHMKKGGKIPENHKTIKKYVDRFGPEVYDILGLPRVGQSVGITIPLLGRINAGEPLPLPPSDFSQFDWESRITVNPEWLPPNMNTEDLYALEVQGDSMIDMGIAEGTTIILKKTNVAENGQIVAVCLDDDNSATLKRIYRENGHIRLQAENPAYKPILVDANKVHVVGRLVVAIRKYY